MGKSRKSISNHSNLQVDSSDIKPDPYLTDLSINKCFKGENRTRGPRWPALYRSPDNHYTKENKSDKDRVKTVTVRVLTWLIFDLT